MTTPQASKVTKSSKAAAYTQLAKQVQESKPVNKLNQESAYVCCKNTLEQAKKSVMDLEGPNAVYDKDSHTVFYHRKILASRIKKALEMEDPHGDTAQDILKSMAIARKHNKDTMPKLVRL